MANEEMAAAWDGDEGARWAADADSYDRASRRHWERFLRGGPVRSGDRVLDVGCGVGRSTRAAARLASSGSVLGVDLSSPMLEEARRRAGAEGIANVAFEQADAQVHPFVEASFDVAISSFGVMFFDDPAAAFANIGRSLRPGGRLAVLVWRELPRNEWLVVVRQALAMGRDLPEPPPGAPGPFGLADEEHVRRVLARAGFRGVALDPVDEPIELGRDPEEAFAFVSRTGFVQGVTEDLDGPNRAEAMRRLQAVLADRATSDGVLLGSSAWLVTAGRP